MYMHTWVSYPSVHPVVDQLDLRTSQLEEPLSRFCGGEFCVTHVTGTKVLNCKIPLSFSQPVVCNALDFRRNVDKSEVACDVCSKAAAAAAAAESTAESRALSRLSDKTLASSIHRHHNHRGAKNRGIYSIQ